MTLDCFACISVIFQAIIFIRWALKSLDSEDCENMWFHWKNIHPAWVSTKTKKVVDNPVLARSHRKIKKYRSKWKFTILKILYLNSPNFSDMIVFWFMEKCRKTPKEQPRQIFSSAYVRIFYCLLMDVLGLFYLYLGYIRSYQLRSLRIWKLRLWGF